MSSRLPSRRDCANAIRALSMDAVQKANSGHPGAPMGMADIAEVLWNDFLKHNPVNPGWVNRDRFVLSNGHGSMLVYSLLHLSGYDVSTDDLRNFRQLHSKTPGHPEFGYTPGVETTLGLGKLIVFYDDNGISIDGDVEGWFTDDTAKRFEAYGWQVLSADGHDAAQIAIAIKAAQADTQRPTLITCKTVIGFGSPNKQGTHNVHGSPLGDAEIAATRAALGWAHAPFEVPEDIRAIWDARDKGFTAESAWKEQLVRYEEEHPVLAMELVRRLKGQLPGHFAAQADEYIRACQDKGENIATRKASQNCLAAFGQHLPEMIGGSADLAGSNLTTWSGTTPITERADGNYINYGVREFGMSAIMNGIALHGGFIPFGGTFLIFMEYARNSVRMAALMKQQCVFVYTHDSIGQGEDGPTHQPVEQVANLRVTPNMAVWRPCDAVESAVAWKAAIHRSEGPTSLVFSRQNLAHQARTPEQLSDIARGAYVLKECDGTPEVIVIATGSEVAVCADAVTALQAQGIRARLVSMPSADAFEAQDEAYREQVLPRAVRARLAVEAAAADYWYKYVGLDGKVIGMTSFGESAPGPVLMKEFGFTVENVVSTATALCRK